MLEEIMFKNKDGSYNKFNLLIFGSILIIAMIIIGTVAVENIEIPKFTINQEAEVVTAPIINNQVYSDNITSLYNGTYNNTTSWNWTYYNSSNTSTMYNWSYGDGNYTFNVTYAGGGGSGYTHPDNTTTYVFVAGGGGVGGSGSIAYITNNSEQSSIVQQPETNLSENITSILVPLTTTSILHPLLILIPIFILMTAFVRNGSSSLIMMLGIFGFLFYFNVLPFILVSIILMGYIFITILRPLEREDY
jgi:hypothetical protein